MGRGRNSKSAVLRDDQRDRRVREEAARHLECAASVVLQWFTGEAELAVYLDALAGKLRDGQRG